MRRGPARHARFSPWRRRRVAVLAATALAAATLPAQPAAASGCSTAELVPQLRQTEVNQGLPAYKEPLVYAKDTIVKLSLSLPSCATSGQSITLASGSALSVSSVASALPTLTTTVTTPMSGGSLVAASQAPALDSAGDPVFTVPGSALAPLAAKGPAFSATFTPAIAYTRNDNGTVSSGSITFPSFSASFDRQQNALRVLVVPMGDFSSSAPQFTTPTTTTETNGANAQSSVQAAFQSVVSRVLPISSGVASLTAPPPATGPVPGLRYAINGGLFDLGFGPNGLKLMNLTTGSQKFCGGYENFSKIQVGLASILRTYNNANPGFAANRVLGVVDESISKGASDGCFEGQAQTGGSAAWARVFYKSGSPDRTGPVIAMELGHSLGLTRPDPEPTQPTSCTRFTGDAALHSRNTAADACSPGRAFNTATATRIGTSRAFSKLSDAAWTGPNVLMEPLDYEFTQCVLGGSSTLCQAYPVMGGFTPAAPRARFTINGSIAPISSTKSAADISDSYVSTGENTYETEEALGSRWVLVYLGGDECGLKPETCSTIDTDGVYVPEQDSAHGHDGANVQQAGSFASSRELPPGAKRVQLRDTAGSGAEAVLYERVVDPNPAPVIVDTAQAPDTGSLEPTTPARVTSTDTTNETAPAQSSNGLIAYVKEGVEDGSRVDGLFVARRAGHATLETETKVDDAGTSPAFSHDGSKIAYERDGDIWTADVLWDKTTGKLTVTRAKEPVYDAPQGAFSARHPSFAPPAPAPLPDEPRLVIEYNRNLWVIALAPGVLPLGCSLPGRVLASGSCKQITGDAKSAELSGTDTSPSWSAATGSQQIAFIRNGGVATVHARDGEFAEDGTSRVTHLVPPPDDGVALADPSFADGLLAYSRGGSVHLWDIEGNVDQRLTHLGSDVRPSLVGSNGGAQLVFQRTFTNQDRATQQDLMAVSLFPNAASTANTYTVVAHDPDGNPADLRAEFIRSCPTSRREVLASAVRPDDINGAYARFRIAANPLAIPSLGCTGGTVQAEVSDGVSKTAPKDTGTISPGDVKPVVAISSPTANATVLPGRTVVLLGTGYGPDQAVLPESTYTWGVQGNGVDRTIEGKARVELTLDAGEYTATLTVRDGTSSSSSTTPFTVRPGTPPVATVSSPAPGTTVPAGTVVNVAGSASDAEDGTLPAASLDWWVTSPDGAVQPFLNTAAFSLTPILTGTWTVQVLATDTHGQTGTSSRTFTVTNPVVSVDVNFSPTTLNAPPAPSDPDWVTVKVRKSGLDLTQVVPSSVKIQQIGPYTAQNDPLLFPTLRGGCLVSTGTCKAEHVWAVEGTAPDLVGTVKFDRKALANYLSLKGLVNQYVRIVVTGDASSYSFSGFDPTSPNVKG